jgi:hypothetical protein
MLEIFHLGYTISREIGLPITPEDRHEYRVTQLLADLIRRQGYEGIRFSKFGRTGGPTSRWPPIFPSNAAALPPIRHRVSREKIERETFPEKDHARRPIQRGVWERAMKAAAKVEKKCGLENLGAWDDFEWGMINGKLSALSLGSRRRVGHARHLTG